MPSYQTTYPIPQPQRRPWKQPQVEPETFSLARRFDGTDDVVRLAIGACNLTGAFTIMVVCRSNIDHIPDNLIVNHNSSNSARVIFSQTEDGAAGLSYLVGLPTVGITGSGITSPNVSETQMRYGIPNDWAIKGVSKAGGSAIPRFHLYIDGTWRHADGQGPLIDPTTQSGGNIRIPANSTFSFDPYDFAVAAEWNGTALSDGQVEALSVNRATSDWLGHAVTPSGLWQFNQSDVATRVTDLTGNGADQVAITGTEVITTGPLGWTYSENPVVEEGIPTLVQRQLVPA